MWHFISCLPPLVIEASKPRNHWMIRVGTRERRYHVSLMPWLSSSVLTWMDCSSYSPMWILLTASHIKFAQIAGVTTYETLLSERQDHLASSFHPALTDIHTPYRSTDVTAAIAAVLSDITSKRAASEHPLLGSEIFQTRHESYQRSTAQSITVTKPSRIFYGHASWELHALAPSPCFSVFLGMDTSGSYVLGDDISGKSRGFCYVRRPS